MKIQIGNFVRIRRLATETGHAKNGKVGIVRKHVPELGQIVIETLGTDFDNVDNYDQEFAYHESMLEQIPSDMLTYKLLELYLRKKTSQAKDSISQLESCLELFGVPGFKASWDEYAFMAVLLYQKGRLRESTRFFETSLQLISASNPKRENLLLSYALALFKNHKLKNSLNALIQIRRGDDYTRAVKISLLKKITCRFFVEGHEDARTALLELESCLDRDYVLFFRNLGDLLIEKGDIQWANHFYKKAEVASPPSENPREDLESERLSSKPKNRDEPPYEVSTNFLNVKLFKDEPEFLSYETLIRSD